MTTPRIIRSSASLLIPALLVTGAGAGEVQLGAAKDNTIYESASGSLSNGMGSRVFTGRTGQGTGTDITRGLFDFDVASAIPAGSTITEVILRLRLTTTNTSTSTDVKLHVASLEWGEGNSNGSMGEGGGGPAQPGDATWLHTFHPGSFWAQSGGDFVATPSASTSVGSALVHYEWTSAQMVADVQAWLDTPGQDHGWILIGNESLNASAKAFDSRHASIAANRPRLTVRFDPPSVGAFCFGSGCPCANDDPAAGCANGTGQGALLSASGNASLANDTLVLSVGQTTNQPGVFFQGNVALAPPLTFGDGFRCCGQSVVRIGTYLPTGNATNTASGNQIGGIGPPISAHPGNGALSAGDSRCYQWWYRDPGVNNPCQGDFFNLSNGVQLSWGA